jgi:hypothetical protein
MDFSQFEIKKLSPAENTSARAPLILHRAETGFAQGFHRGSGEFIAGHGRRFSVTARRYAEYLRSAE